MIYQLYYRPEHYAHLLDVDPYRPFGLEPCVNAAIARNCPELARGVNRNALCEYAAMLHLWRNPPADDDDWIGFTSWRQSMKGVRAYGRHEVASALRAGDIVSWGEFAPGPPGDGPLASGILQVLEALGRACPPEWQASSGSFFANYWAMPLDAFCQYMDWSYPICAWALDRLDTHDFVRRRGPGNEPFVGELLERAVQIWQLMTRRSVHYIGALDLGAFPHQPKGHEYVGPDIESPPLLVDHR